MEAPPSIVVANESSLGISKNQHQTATLPGYWCNCSPPVGRHSLCESCRHIDFDGDPQLIGKTQWVSTYSQQPFVPDKSCRLCRFLAQIDYETSDDDPFHGHNWEISIYRLTWEVVPKTVFRRQFRDGGRAWRIPKPDISMLRVHSLNGIAGRHISEHYADLRVVDHWLNHCSTNHPTCQTDIGDELTDFQAIDITSMAVLPLPRRAKFATLSYVWGTPSDECIGASGLPEQLPRTVRDAVLVASKLGYRYLWVDRYCIPQGSAASKHGQIRRMAELYAKSSLTIIAAAAKDADYGIPGVSRARIRQPTVRIGNCCLVAIAPPRLALNQTKWSTRGWTYQEALLSRRRLVFLDNCVFFECQEMHMREDVSVPGDQPKTVHSLDEQRIMLPMFPAKPSQTISQWDIQKYITEFQNRDLTYDSDAINAVVGILKQYIGRLFVGLPILQERPSIDHETTQIATKFWTCELGDSLAWYSGRSVIRRRQFPSWSWAGWKRLPGLDREQPPLFSHDITSQFCSMLFRISAHYQDGSNLYWGPDSKTILTRSDMGVYPNSLVVSGWTFDILFDDPDCKFQSDHLEQDYALGIPSRQFYSGYQRHNLPSQLRDLQGVNFATQKFGVLVLRYVHCEERHGRYGHVHFECLILRKRGDVLERCITERYVVKGKIIEGMAGDRVPRIPSVTLKKREIRMV